MKPIDPGAEYGELRVYGAGQPEYELLVARTVVGKALLTKWQLSEDDRRAILDGANLMLHILTFGHPLQPVSLWIEGTPDDPLRPEEADEDDTDAREAGS